MGLSGSAPGQHRAEPGEVSADGRRVCVELGVCPAPTQPHLVVQHVIVVRWGEGHIDRTHGRGGDPDAVDPGHRATVAHVGRLAGSAASAYKAAAERSLCTASYRDS